MISMNRKYICELCICQPAKGVVSTTIDMNGDKRFRPIALYRRKIVLRKQKGERKTCFVDNMSEIQLDNPR